MLGMATSTGTLMMVGGRISLIILMVWERDKTVDKTMGDKFIKERGHLGGKEGTENIL